MRPTKKEVYELLDVTSLSVTDTTTTITSLIKEINALIHIGFTPAAICVYPNFGHLVKHQLHESVKTAVVAGGFPASQSFLDVKLLECKKAIESRADEIDIVMNIGAFLENDFSTVQHEIKQIKLLCTNTTLKVILETGVLSLNQITKAAKLAIDAGADFIKTSTGKVPIGATIEAVKSMCHAIQSSPRKVGLKISGGVKTYDDALTYIEIVSEILGSEYIHPNTFRIGASSLTKDLVQL